MMVAVDRSLILAIEQQRADRLVDAELRVARAADGADTPTVTLSGVASRTGVYYDVAGGTWPGWREMIMPGAFRRTLDHGPDVAFLVNHEGLPLARTTAGTLALREVTQTSDAPAGLHMDAQVDTRVTVARDLVLAVERGDVREMSFAFRVLRDEWFDDDGRPSDPDLGTVRHIHEVSIHRGDVSAVTYGANPATSIGVAARAMLALQRGRVDAPEVAVLRDLLDRHNDKPDTEQIAESEQVSDRDQYLAQVRARLEDARSRADMSRAASRSR